MLKGAANMFKAAVNMVNLIPDSAKNMVTLKVNSRLKNSERKSNDNLTTLKNIPTYSLNTCLFNIPTVSNNPMFPINYLSLAENLRRGTMFNLTRNALNKRSTSVQHVQFPLHVHRAATALKLAEIPLTVHFISNMFYNRDRAMTFAFFAFLLIMVLRPPNGWSHT